MTDAGGLFNLNQHQQGKVKRCPASRPSSLTAFCGLANVGFAEAIEQPECVFPHPLLFFLGMFDVQFLTHSHVIHGAIPRLETWTVLYLSRYMLRKSLGPREYLDPAGLPPIPIFRKLAIG